jgi:hypothetical protein
MNTPSLMARIQTLSDELRKAGELDVATRRALVSLQRDIEKLLHDQGEVSLTERLEQLAVRFENDHPAAGTALRQAIDALAKAGM